jgi:hypothetical protein
MGCAPAVTASGSAAACSKSSVSEIGTSVSDGHVRVEAVMAQPDASRL